MNRVENFKKLRETAVEFMRDVSRLRDAFEEDGDTFAEIIAETMYGKIQASVDTIDLVQARD